MRWIPWLLGVNGIILLITTSHLRIGLERGGRVLSSVGLFVLTIPAVTLFGIHMCDEGSAPPFVIFATAILAASIPWIIPAHPWWIRSLVAITISCGILTAGHLASSYHSDNITGNPNYASERFWHTSFTGQYPRDNEKMDAYRRQRHNRPEAPPPTNSEQGESPKPRP